MKTRILAVLVVLSLSLFSERGVAAEPTAASGELNDLVAKVKAKLQENKRTEADLAPELREFEALLAKHKGEKTDDVAQILLMEAMLYLQVLDNNEKGTELIKQLQRDFPGTKPAENADKTLASMKKQAEAKKIKAALAEGTKFPDFEVKDTTGKPLSIANYKGKVVLSRGAPPRAGRHPRCSRLPVS